MHDRSRTGGGVDGAGDTVPGRAARIGLIVPDVRKGTAAAARACGPGDVDRVGFSRVPDTSAGLGLRALPLTMLPTSNPVYRLVT